jgi:hypothetical protein
MQLVFYFYIYLMLNAYVERFDVMRKFLKKNDFLVN